MKFFLIARGEVVGWSALPWIDVGMNVAWGPFFPNEKYADVQPLIREYHYHDGSLGKHNPAELARAWKDIEALNFRVECEDGQQLYLQPNGSIAVTDFSQELEEEALEVAVIGLTSETMKKYWPREWDAF